MSWQDLTVPVEEVREGDRIRSPRGRILVVERVDLGEPVYSVKGELLLPARYFIRTRPWGTLVPRHPGTLVDIEREKEEA